MPNISCKSISIVKNILLHILKKTHFFSLSFYNFINNFRNIRVHIFGDEEYLIFLFWEIAYSKQFLQNISLVYQGFLNSGVKIFYPNYKISKLISLVIYIVDF